MRVSAVQFKPVFRDIQANLMQMGALAHQAATGGAELIVFPELATCGYSFMSREEALPFAEDFYSGSAPSLAYMQGLSQATNAALVWGFMESSQGILYNAQALVTPEGGLALYKKRNRWANDFLWASKGDHSPTIVSWRGRTIGLLICRDIRDKSDVSSAIYEAGDADIVAFSSNFGKGGFPPVSWMDFAENNQTNLVVSNRYGDEGNNNFGGGGICVIRPSGKVEAAGLIFDEDCIVYADV